MCDIEIPVKEEEEVTLSQPMQERNHLFRTVIKKELVEFKHHLDECRPDWPEKIIFISTDVFVAKVEKFYSKIMANLEWNRPAQIKLVLMKLQNCTDCLMNELLYANDHVVIPCRKPHKVLWYKRSRFVGSGKSVNVMIPAKVLFVDNKSKKVYLQLFTDAAKPAECFVVQSSSKKRYCELTNRYLFSNKNYRDDDRDFVNDAVDLLNEYIKNIYDLFGIWKYRVYNRHKRAYDCKSHLMSRLSVSSRQKSPGFVERAPKLVDLTIQNIDENKVTVNDSSEMDVDKESGSSDIVVLSVETKGDFPVIESPVDDEVVLPAVAPVVAPVIEPTPMEVPINKPNSELFEYDGKTYDLEEIKRNQPIVRVGRLTVEDMFGYRVNLSGLNPEHFKKH